MKLTRYLGSKESHGDIDLLVLPKDPKTFNLKHILYSELGDNIIQYKENYPTNSML